MTNPSGDRDTIWLSGFRGVWKNGLSPSASPPDPPESLESNSITCHPLDQSLFVYCDRKRGSTLFLRSVAKTSTALVLLYFYFKIMLKFMYKISFSKHKLYHSKGAIVPKFQSVAQLDPKQKLSNCDL